MLTGQTRRKTNISLDLVSIVSLNRHELLSQPAYISAKGEIIGCFVSIHLNQANSTDDSTSYCPGPYRTQSWLRPCGNGDNGRRSGRWIRLEWGENMDFECTYRVGHPIAQPFVMPMFFQPQRSVCRVGQVQVGLKDSWIPY